MQKTIEVICLFVREEGVPCATNLLSKLKCFLIAQYFCDFFFLPISN